MAYGAQSAPPAWLLSRSKLASGFLFWKGTCIVSSEVRPARIELGRQTRNGTGLLAWLSRHRAHWIAVLALLAAVGLWELLVRWQQYPAFILPAPALWRARRGWCWRMARCCVTR
jgi:hypothetical protein